MSRENEALHGHALFDGIMEDLPFKLILDFTGLVNGHSPYTAARVYRSVTRLSFAQPTPSDKLDLMHVYATVMAWGRVR